jgi:sugar phosphate isomerase/epimerase
MKNINRRKFAEQASIALGGALAFSQIPSYLRANVLSQFLDVPVGFQTFPIRDILSKDIPGTFKIMADLGYKKAEMCSPAGYKDIGFGKFASMTGSDIRKIINDAGLSCPSCHFGYGELTDKLDVTIEFAKQLGISTMVCSTFWLPKTAGLKEYKESADKLNKIAQKISEAGMQTGFHNHDMEFASIDGTLIYDALMSEFDPKLIKMQFQTEVINLGYKASDYFIKYPGRFFSSHLSDWTTDKKETPIGKGVINWKEFFTAAKIGGVRDFYVEMDMDNMKDSAANIHALSL